MSGMTRYWWRWALGKLLVLGGAIGFSGNCAFAQSNIVPDNSLGAESSVVTPNVDINGIPSDRIDGGATRSANLFHSFQEFNIDSGRGAYFTNPAGIENIFSRVTGGNRSEIFGKLGVLGNANLFLINPSGIIFGQNASLDVKGSFVGTTASSLNFADGTKFSATVPQTTPLLTISVPIGLQFGSNPRNIVNQSQATDSSGETVGLQVQPGRTLALVGRDIVLEGGNLAAPDGRIELGSIAGNSLVSLTPTNTGYTLGYQGVDNFQDIRLTQEAFVSTSGDSGGSIQVQGANVMLTDGSEIEANTLGAGSGEGLTVNASKSVQLIGESADGQYISGLFTQAQLPATGKAGTLTINTPVLLVRDGAQVAASSFGSGKGGILNINAESVQVIGESTDSQTPSGLFASTDGTGKAGDLTITTRQLLVQDGAQVVTGTRGSGDGGSLSVNASESVQLIGRSRDGQSLSGLFSGTQATGKGGDLTITTQQLLIQDGAQVQTSTFSSGDGGNLYVNASESVQVIGAELADGQFSSGLFAGTTGRGKSGDLTITTKQLFVRDGAQIASGSFGSGRGGRLTVNASKSVQLIGRSPDGQFGSGLITATARTGNAGSLSITTQQLLIQDGAQATVSSSGEGAAGDLGINASSVRLDEGNITAQTLSGNGGNLTLSVADLLLMRRGSEISTTAGIDQKGGDGGNITINTPNGFIVAVPNENSDITANAYTGSGGNVQIRAFSIYGTQFREKPTLETSDITASSELGVNGTVEINTPDVDLNRGLVNLPVVLLDTEVSQVCQPRTAENQSSFIITGRGGLPPNPRTEPLTPDAVQVDWVTLNPGTENRVNTDVSKLTTPTPAPIVEAQGWVRNAKGEVVLTANAPTATPHSSWQTPAFCHGD